MHAFINLSLIRKAVRVCQKIEFPHVFREGYLQGNCANKVKDLYLHRKSLYYTEKILMGIKTS